MAQEKAEAYQNNNENDRITVTETYDGEEIQHAYKKARTPVTELTGNGHFGFRPPFHPHTYRAAKGILCDQDVAVKMRDGVTIYVDIYRPEGESDIPAIMSWSPFGKRPGDGFDEWKIMGVPARAVSKMAKFESSDPAYWCHRGYAIVNVDPRGVGWSEGNINLFGTQIGRDGYDLTEWLAEQWWCNGRVGMSGNSAVAMSQWRVAAEQPPHLACIAPWEGTGDFFREGLFEGGIPAVSFWGGILNGVTGDQYVDDYVTMAEKYPYWNGYWADKYPKWEKIRCPAYVCGCWQHLHLRGSLDGFRKIRSPQKWLRVHRDFEWADMYCEEGLHDLERFFDRYLKDIYNGWELTPKVRIEVMDSYELLYQKNRPEKEWPLARTQYTKLYLDAENAAMCPEPVAVESKTAYDAETGIATFDYKFNEETEITGYSKLHLWVEAQGHNQMDLFINMQKLSPMGEFLYTDAIGEPHPGSWGKLRVSRRRLDDKLTTEYEPVLAHVDDQYLSPGEIVPVDIAIVPVSRIFHKGEQLRIQICGRYLREGWFEPLEWNQDNKGTHIIHTGGKYESWLQIPVIPPRIVADGYIAR